MPDNVKTMQIFAGMGRSGKCGLDCGLEFSVSRPITPLERMAGTTGLEPAASAVTGQQQRVMH
jgi:hypothetical protein